MRLPCAILLASVLFIVFAIGIVLLIPFPIVIFQKLVDSQVYLQRQSDGQFPKSTFYWSKLPAVQYFNFYLFNITNPDEVLYNGATPAMLEVGPYTYAETEFKDFIEFRDNDNSIFYQNNKTWIFDKSRSCDDCNFEDVMNLPNTAYSTLVFMELGLPKSPVVQIAMDVLAILLGEQPIRTISASGVLFVGYSDPLIDLVNSPLTKALVSFLGNPAPMPQVVAGGYFPQYNHTCDGNYTLLTGKDNTDNTALIQTWDDITHLSWWSTEEAQDIRNSGDGSFQKPGLQKTDVLKQFQSFTCRAYNLRYAQEESYVNGIPSLSFNIDSDSYDAVTHSGYRYENFEKVDYFPKWPCGSNHTYHDNGNCAMVNCTIVDNFCSSCCKGSNINGTYLMPPGITPQRCFPGQNNALPFGAFLTGPHFYGSPNEVTDKMIGIHPDKEKHSLGTFKINPATGSTVGGKFRMQLSHPIFKSAFTTMSNSPNTIMPSFWLDINIEMRDYAINFIYFNVVTLPNIVLGVGIALVAISIIAILLWGFLYFRKRRNSSVTIFKNNTNNRIASWTVTDSN